MTEYTVTGELAEPFDVLPGDELRRVVAVRPARLNRRSSSGQSGCPRLADA